MDALFHLVIAYIGGLILLKNLGTKASPTTLLILSTTSLLVTDIDHFINLKTPLFHNILLLIILPTIVLYLLHRKGNKKYFNYTLTLTVMFTGHLLTDMVAGMYGIPLLYPLSNTLYMMPEGWEITVPGDPTGVIVSRLGIALLLYFGLILLLPKFFPSESS